MTVDQAPLQGRRILVIEDEYLVAQLVVDFLEDAGAEVVGPLGWVDEAVAFIQSHHSSVDGAVLDVNLHGSESYAIADALVAKNLSFVFVTGYGERALEGAYKSFPRCEKPFKQQDLVKALACLF
jgi:CheY-like chemotaxis protein